MIADYSQIRGEIRQGEPLSQHTTWRAGGAAREFFRPADVDDLISFLQQHPKDRPLLWVGLGSNLLVRDGGFEGTVICTQGRLDGVTVEGDRLIAEAGASCAKVARQAARSGLCGVEFLAGIPGTVGGALAMNAGAFGGETWEQIESVSTVDSVGQSHQRKPEEYSIGYRSVSGPEGEWFIAATFKLSPGDVSKGQQRIRELLELRNSKQPIGKPSCGSVFRNPHGDYAARLIEASGLKGYEMGGAQVSPKHANFIVNNGDASADDIERLIEHVQSQVYRDSGVKLQTEVHIVGERSVAQ